jgi:hypothetical protein
MSLEELPKFIHLFGLQNSLRNNRETCRGGVNEKSVFRFHIAQVGFPLGLAAGNSRISLQRLGSRNIGFLANWLLAESR